MKVALIAHDKKKEEMVNFAKMNEKRLSHLELYATGTTGLKIMENTNLEIHRLKSGPLGGDQQIDLVIFLRDPLNPKSHEPDIHKAIRLCDMHNIPLASNVATAELLIKSLEHGDLEWREAYNA